MSSSSGKLFWKITRWARAGRFWLFVAIAAAAYLGFGGDARAQTAPQLALCDDVTYRSSSTSGNEMCRSRQDAYAKAFMALQHVAGQIPQCAPYLGTQPNLLVYVGGGSQTGRYQLAYDYSAEFCRSSSTQVFRRWPAGTDCPDGGVWDDDENRCVLPCSERPPLVDRAKRGSLVICEDNCSYSATGGVDSFSFTFGDYSAGEEWHPTGADCGIDDPGEPWDPERETCRTIPGASFSECIKPDGSHCVTGAKGTRMCWQPGESGERMATSGEEGANKGPSNSDPPPPNGMEDPSKVGETTTTINGDTTTTNVFEGGGNSGGQGNTGTGGSEDSGEGEDGSVSGGGSCDAAPVCSGDPVMCAINEGTWRARCAGAEGGDDAVVDFNDALADGDDDADLSALEDAADPNNWREIEDMGDHVLDESGFAGGGNCPVLPSFSVGPSSVTISLTPLCDLLVSLSSLVMGLAYFMGFKIIAGVK